jgi:hypothetical protein
MSNIDDLMVAISGCCFVHYDREGQMVWYWHENQRFVDIRTTLGKYVGSMAIQTPNREGAELWIRNEIRKRHMRRMEIDALMDQRSLERQGWTDDADLSICGCSDPLCDCEGSKL